MDEPGSRGFSLFLASSAKVGASKKQRNSCSIHNQKMMYARARVMCVCKLDSNPGRPPDLNPVVFRADGTSKVITKWMTTTSIRRGGRRDDLFVVHKKLSNEGRTAEKHFCSKGDFFLSLTRSVRTHTHMNKETFGAVLLLLLCSLGWCAWHTST